MYAPQPELQRATVIAAKPHYEIEIVTWLSRKLGFKYNFILDYTCRARWPEGLLCSTISLKSCNLAQILQSPKSEIVTCVMFSTHTNTSLIKPHLTELDEIHRNRPKSNYNLAKNLQSWPFLERYIKHRTRTDGRTDRDSHIFYLAPPCRSRTQ